MIGFICLDCSLLNCGFVMCSLGFGSGPAMKFRNYVPQAKELQDSKVVPPELPKFEDPIAAIPPAVEKKEVCGLLFIFSRSTKILSY